MASAATPAAAAAGGAAYQPSRPPLVVPAARQHRSTLVMLHGLGDSGAGWAFLSRALAAHLPHTEFVFPSAPLRPISSFGGQQSTAWFDIPATSPEQGRKQDAAGMHASRRYIEVLLREQAARGVPRSRVVVGGFSQGAAVALLMLRSELPLAGVLALSGFLPLAQEEPLVAEVNARTPTLQLHGDADSMITLERAQRGAELLQAAAGDSFRFHIYPGMGHTTREDELQDIRQFLLERLG